MRGAFKNNGLVERALDSVTSAMFVLAADLGVLYINKAGLALLASGESSAGERLGDKLGCGYALRGPQGCTTSPFCKKCVVRRIVRAALRAGEARKARLMFRRMKDGELTPVPVIVGASPFRFGGRSVCFLCLDDMSGLAELHSLLPICANCKKIRMDDDYWEQIEVYINKHLADIKFTHGFCPACVEKLYPGLAGKAGG